MDRVVLLFFCSMEGDAFHIDTRDDGCSTPTRLIADGHPTPVFKTLVLCMYMYIYVYKI